MHPVLVALLIHFRNFTSSVKYFPTKIIRFFIETLLLIVSPSNKNFYLFNQYLRLNSANFLKIILNSIKIFFANLQVRSKHQCVRIV
jgi:hypothetical protein